MKGLCGFSRETVVAVTTNIESIEFRRRQNAELGYEEHPRAGTTDDVEAFFALLHRYLGLIFTLKEFKALWRKLVRYEETLYIIINMGGVGNGISDLLYFAFPVPI